jgi:hypothetical protein
MYILIKKKQMNKYTIYLISTKKNPPGMKNVIPNMLSFFIYIIVDK